MSRQVRYTISGSNVSFISITTIWVALAVAIVGAHLLAFGPGRVLAQDGETGWTTPINISEVPDLFSDSPALLCDKYENLHVIWIERDDEHAYIYYRHRSETGWSEPNSIHAPESIKFLDGVIAGDDVLHLLWFTNDGRVEYSLSAIQDAGDARKWSIPLTLADGVGPHRHVFGGGGSIGVDPNDSLYVVFSKPEDATNRAHTLYYIQSSDGGQVWSAPVPVFSMNAAVPVSLFGSIKVDADAQLHVVWEIRSLEYGLYSQVGYMRSQDAGFSWDPPILLAESDGFPGVAMPAVFVFGKNEVHLTWDTPARLHQWSSDGGETWSEPVLIMAAGAAFGGFNQLAIDSSGTLHVVSAEVAGVFHATWDGTGWIGRETVDSGDFDPHLQQLEVCEGNRLHVVYADLYGLNEIWYSARTIRGEHRAAVPIPDLRTSVAAESGSGDQPEVIASPNLTPVNTNPIAAEWDKSSRSPANARLIMPTVSAVLVILGISFYVRRSRD